MPQQTNGSSEEPPAAPDKRMALKVVQSFLGDSGYRDYVENAASFNTRLLVERRMRLPFLDAQTGIAQNSSMLFFNRRDRMPGDSRVGKIYTYPAARWRKRRRQYYLNFFNFPRKPVNPTKLDQVENVLDPEASMSQASTSALTETGEDSREALLLPPPPPPPPPPPQPQEAPRMVREDASWAYYDDDLGIDEDDFEHSHEVDSDYEDNSKKKKKGKSRGKESAQKTPRGRKKGFEKNFEIDSEKPFGCDRSKSKKNKEAANAAQDSADDAEDEASSGATPGGGGRERSSGRSKSSARDDAAEPSPYCDFCLGDASENRKTREPEELISCSHCGRSGHPTCLQFTQNMIISVKKYRWQCIECKCCTMCGNSDNDDQLLFCDDCDRGYHMYCLNPPLSSPPDGSWSCDLCVKEFHS